MVQHRLPTSPPGLGTAGKMFFVRFGFVVCVVAFVCFIVLLAGLITSTYWRIR